MRRSRSASNCGCSTDTATDCGYGQWGRRPTRPTAGSPVVGDREPGHPTGGRALDLDIAALDDLKVLQADLRLTDEGAHRRGRGRVVTEVAGHLQLLHGVGCQPESLCPRGFDGHLRSPGGRTVDGQLAHRDLGVGSPVGVRAARQQTESEGHHEHEPSSHAGRRGRRLLGCVWLLGRMPVEVTRPAGPSPISRGGPVTVLMSGPGARGGGTTRRPCCCSSSGDGPVDIAVAGSSGLDSVLGVGAGPTALLPPSRPARPPTSWC